MARQTVFDVTPGCCPECGITFADDFEIYSLRVCRRHHARGVCVACAGVQPTALHSARNSAQGFAVSSTAKCVVWRAKAVGFPALVTRRTEDEWPGIVLSPADKLFRLRNCILDLPSGQRRRVAFEFFVSRLKRLC